MSNNFFNSPSFIRQPENINTEQENVFSPEELNVLEERYDKMKNNIEPIVRNINQLKENFPEDYTQFKECFPRFHEIEEQLIDFYNELENSATPLEMARKITRYNQLVRVYNIFMLPIQEEFHRGPREAFSTASDLEQYNGNWINNLSQEQKHEVCQTVRSLFRDMFINNTTIGSSVRGITGEILGNYTRNPETGELTYQELEASDNITIAVAILTNILVFTSILNTSKVVQLGRVTTTLVNAGYGSTNFSRLFIRTPIVSLANSRLSTV